MTRPPGECREDTRGRPSGHPRRVEWRAPARQEQGAGEPVRAVYLLGLATDYCVKYSALDALALGFETYVIADGCRGVNLRTGDSERALEELQTAGVRITTSRELVPPAATAVDNGGNGAPASTGMLP